MNNGVSHLTPADAIIKKHFTNEEIKAHFTRSPQQSVNDDGDDDLPCSFYPLKYPQAIYLIFFVLSTIILKTYRGLSTEVLLIESSKSSLFLVVLFYCLALCYLYPFTVLFSIIGLFAICGYFTKPN